MNDNKEHQKNDMTLTNRQGHPITNNQNIRTVGNRDPATLENYDFIEKISHLDREKVPVRIVHAVLAIFPKRYSGENDFLCRTG